MVHAVFLVLGVFMVAGGVVICALMVAASLKGGKGLWLVTVPGILVIATSPWTSPATSFISPAMSSHTRPGS